MVSIFPTTLSERLINSKFLAVGSNDGVLEINKEQIHKIISKNRKAPVCIPNEFLKYDDELFDEQLAVLFSNINNIGKGSKLWKTNVTVSIFNNEQTGDPDNYHGITLLTTAEQLLTKMMLLRLQRYLEIKEE